MTSAPSRRQRTRARLWRAVVLTACLPVVLGVLLWGASVMSDSHRVPAALAAWALESGVMLCTEGRIVHGDGSVADRLLGTGQFRCGAWRMRGPRPTPAGLVEWPSSPRR
jgi:hypothetical protein